MADKRARYGRSRLPAAEAQRRAAVIEDCNIWRELLKHVVFVNALKILSELSPQRDWHELIVPMEPD